MKQALLVASLILMSSSAHAYDYNYGYNQNNSNSGYQSSFGNNYQYDLSNQIDRNMYDIDPAAQIRDSIDVNPSRSLERGIGQYGGVYSN